MSPELIDSSRNSRRGSFHVYESWLRRLGRLPRLLIAEDHRDTRTSLTELFERSGYDVRAVSDGSALLHRLGPMLLSEPGHWPPDVILTDVKMPGIDALSVLEELREVGWETPAIVITGFGNDGIRDRVRALQQVDLCEKPVDVDALERAVAEAVGDLDPEH